ncbi:oxygen-independent coproporphyrinogen III oxidase [Sinomicrobium soli]|uniref:oxygen-independent coproporphyrinogen III oxidase n=1 Tax=Sinomicrobium sp. N-1-3-6 TaxID=2219864 RepID=UPI000DCE3A3C|nr:oxygen-independent coproporphyrinogen III oxidase [Sinomicrobium sp. N-1-3-6]RAV27618.1 oxygen-independent coproporphyrinogen III oxidase [Sinomicrobium sp. N-1-3-6]
MSDSLFRKYDIPGPRYTSYPTVPYWVPESFSCRDWISSVKGAFLNKDHSREISLYIHLPFCESLCTFCACHKRITRRHEVEEPYIETVLKEWKLYAEKLGSIPRIRELHLGGGTPTFFSPEHLEQLITGIFRYAERTPEAEFSFEGHPNNTTEAHLDTLHALGFTRVSFGIQDYAPHVQKAINRIQSFDTVRSITRQARESGFSSVSHDLVFGLPFQALEDIRDTTAKTIALKPDRIALYSYAHVPWLPGNGQRGFNEGDLPSGKEKRILYETARHMLEAAGYAEIGMDHFALEGDQLFKAAKNGSLHRNFMGYTTTDTPLLIGLGASAISDSGSGFAQNVKSVEEYTSLVNNDVLPLLRGHLLNKEDLVIRKHILNLMCSFRTSWESPAMRLPQLAYIVERLEEPVRDGLVEILDHGIRITPAGKPFVRNICMAFDLRLQRKKPDTRLFSATV